MIGRPRLGALVGALMFTMAGSAFADSPSELRAEMQNLLDRFRTDYGFPGATAACALPNGTVLTVASGLADTEAQIPMTPQSRMLAASIGKSFVAATVLALETDGRLSQSDPVADHLGALEGYERLPNHATMTIADLLRHSAGLPDHVHMDAFAVEMARRLANGEDALSPQEAISFVFGAEPLFPAGAGWDYSDTGYLLLGLLIEKVAGETYFDLVAERFLSPLSLDATEPSNQRSLADLAVGYTVPENPFGLPARTMDESGRLLWDPAVEWTGGGLLSTSSDLARWGHALFTGSAMQAPYLERLLDGIPVTPETPTVRYGAGVAIYGETPHGAVYGHGGWVPGYVSSLRHYADHGVTVAFQINTDVGIADDSTDLVPALEAALADLAIGYADHGSEHPAE